MYNLFRARCNVFSLTKKYNPNHYFKNEIFSTVYNALFFDIKYYSQSRKYIRKDKAKKFIIFDNLMQMRKDEARKSILIQVNSEQSFKELHSYCSQFGNINGIHHYVIPSGTLHFMLVEFSKEADVNSVLQSSSHIEGHGVPVVSPFLWFRAVNNKSNSNRQTKLKGDAKLLITNGINIPNEEDIKLTLQNAQDVSEQITVLHKATRLNDLGTRIRFLAARQVELAMTSMFPNANVRPFGSSVNGFGKLGCDLDLVLRLENEEHKNENSRLVFHTKTSNANGRSQTQRQMEAIGDLLHLFIPGCAHVRRILQARVPIIKYHQELTGLECDLSMSNLSGVYMSELLYLYGCLDDRVQPLIFTIRKWAQCVSLTNPSPGRWISNFSLSLLVIFFLQQRHLGSILPSFQQLVDSAGPNDMRVTEDQINCTFLRDITKLENWSTKNNDSLEILLLHFYEFYSSFDFQTHGISITKGEPIVKPDHSALYIMNPLEPHLNVSKNVSFEETERFRVEVRNAAWILESVTEKSNSFSWGLLNIFRSNMVSLKTPTFFTSQKSRMMDVKELFEDDVENIEFKNEQVKNEVQAIQNERKSEINKIKTNSRARRR